MGWDSEREIKAYYGKYKKGGLFGKQCSIDLLLYSSRIEGNAFEYYQGELSDDSYPFEISYESIQKMYVGRFKSDVNLTIEYRRNSVVQGALATIMLMGIEEPHKWLQIIETTREEYFKELDKKRKIESEKKERERQLNIQEEENASRFYQKCYEFHIKETIPVFSLFTDKNRMAAIYIDEDKGLNFLRIDGYTQEEDKGLITYDKIHYFEKAGNIHYTTDIHGDYSCYGGSIAGGDFSKFAAIGGGLLFGLMGMAAGAALTYQPMEQKPVEANFAINSDVRMIDDRNVILNFYSDSKEQYIDIELPYNVYNFLLTYLPEKKYGIVDELEKRTAVHQSAKLIEGGDLLSTPASQTARKIEAENEDNDIIFAQKVKKLKMLKEAELISKEEFDAKRKELLDMI